MSEGVSLWVGPGPAGVLDDGEVEASRGGSLVVLVNQVFHDSEADLRRTAENCMPMQGDGKQE